MERRSLPLHWNFHQEPELKLQLSLARPKHRAPPKHLSVAVGELVVKYSSARLGHQRQDCNYQPEEMLHNL